MVSDIKDGTARSTGSCGFKFAGVKTPAERIEGLRADDQNQRARILFRWLPVISTCLASKDIGSLNVVQN